MIHQIRYIHSRETNPYVNLGLEEYLLYQVQRGECILYLWQNQNTVVVGKNQNSWKECKIQELEQQEGHLVRRLSGGGAVYHDLGNLNFTFLVREEDYDLNRQMEVILKGVQQWGIGAKKSGRNDITVEGRKISGNAFFSSQGYCYHHGTILINVDMNQLTRYLNVSGDKIRSKGVESVRSRVVNLKEFNRDVTIEGMRENLIKSFGEVYGLQAEELVNHEIDQDKVQQLAQKFASWEWKYGRRIPFTVELSKRFSWGDICIQLNVDGGYIHEVNAYSDGMDVEFIAALPGILEGKIFSKESLIATVGELSQHNELMTSMARDIVKLMEEQLP